jgi:hypothetical protein
MFGNRSEFEELARLLEIESTIIGQAAAEIAKLPKANPRRERVCVITYKSSPIVATKDKVESF